MAEHLAPNRRHSAAISDEATPSGPDLTAILERLANAADALVQVAARLDTANARDAAQAAQSVRDAAAMAFEIPSTPEPSPSADHTASYATTGVPARESSSARPRNGSAPNDFDQPDRQDPQTAKETEQAAPSKASTSAADGEVRRSDIHFTVEVTAAEGEEPPAKKRGGRRSKVESMKTVQTNAPSDRQFGYFFRRALELYEVLKQREDERRRAVFESGDREAMMREAQVTIHTVLTSPLITPAEKNELLRAVIDKVVPYEDRIEITYL